MAKTSISLCMITKNEENHIEQCLNSVKEIADEIIIIDTGSTDKTQEVIKSFAEKFHVDVKFLSFTWSDDFSAARNESLKHASKDWVLVMDADEILDEEGRNAIKELVKDNSNDAYLFLQKNYTNESSMAGFNSEEHKKDGKVYSGWYGSYIARLFRNNKGYLFDGTVHELVEPSVEGKNGKIAATDVALHHYGNAEPAIAAKKRKFYLQLCENKIKQKPNAPAYYELGVLYKENNKPDKAIESFKKAVELNKENYLALYEMGVICEQQKNIDEAIKYYKESLAIKGSSEAFQNLGVCYLKKGMLKESYESLMKAMLINPNKHTIYNNLGAVLERLGNYDSAAQMLEIATKLNKRNTIGFYNLGIVLDKKGDFENALKNYGKAVELGHKNSEEIKKRIAQLKKMAANDPKYNYSFKAG